jgi:hypothetical protein
MARTAKAHMSATPAELTQILKAKVQAAKELAMAGQPVTQEPTSASNPVRPRSLDEDSEVTDSKQKPPPRAGQSVELSRLADFLRPPTTHNNKNQQKKKILLSPPKTNLFGNVFMSLG